jgi:hypothetical protein
MNEMSVTTSAFKSPMFCRLLNVLEDMETGTMTAHDSVGEYVVLAYRPIDSWGEEMCHGELYDVDTELLEIARTSNLHDAISALIEHLASIEQLEMAREFIGKLEVSGIANDAMEERLHRVLTNESRRLFAYWALTFMSLDTERFEAREESSEKAIVLFSWSAMPPYHEDGITVIQSLR